MDPALAFLNTVLPSNTASSFHVTLTFAQSLDGKIAGKHGQQLILSGKESMRMTHWMRSMHDCILVGINTVLNDDPQLNTRHLPPRDTPYPQPLPVILDTNLRLPLGCKLVRNATASSGRFPLLLCRKVSQDPSFEDKYKQLLKLGVRIIRVPLDPAGRISLESVVNCLQTQGYGSLMVEGGQQVISSCFAEPSSLTLINRVIVTIAPTIVGGSGISVTSETSDKTLQLHHLHTSVLGNDIVAAYSVSRLAGT